MMKHKILSLTIILAVMFSIFANVNMINSTLCEDSSLPISYRRFLVGVTPTYRLNGTLEEPYMTAGSVAEVMNLWFVNVPWYNTTEHLKKPETQGLLWLINISGLTPIFQLNFWTVQSGRVVLQIPPDMNHNTTNLGSLELRQRWIEQAVNISRDYQPKYFCLGNEIDTYYWNCSQADFDNYVSLIAETYDAIKAVSPKTKIFTVFRLSTIVSYDGWFLIEKFDKSKIDLFGFTSYPYMLGYPAPPTYEKPNDMPSDYYTRIMNYTGDVPLVFSEIGWTSSELLRDGSQREQVEFLTWFLNHTKNMPLEIVSWLCLHDFLTVEEETESYALPNHFAGLKYKNGQEKMVWSYWQALYNLPSKRGTINLDKEAYALDDIAFIKVVDVDLNSDPYSFDTITVNVTSTTDIIGINVLLNETGADTSVFIGSFTFTVDSSNDQEDVLKASKGDTINVTYYDEDAGFDEASYIEARAILEIIITEFSPSMLLLAPIMATLLIVIVYRKKKQKQTKFGNL
ncbi:MAG: hypothetical protein ACUVWK_04780 [Nitrososphaerales archaeon]